MLRGFAIVVSALATISAQAQEAKGAKATSASSAPENGARPVLVAARTSPPATSDTRATAPANGGSPTAKLAKAPDEPADCSAVESFLEGRKLVVRNYQAPQTAPTRGWQQAPFVAAVARCGRLYIVKLRSESQDPWVVRQARVAAPDGVVLQVQALRSKELRDQGTINVIVAKAPAEAKLSTLRLDLSGEDGRVAQADAGDLP